jgi:hypothetical protein
MTKLSKLVVFYRPAFGRKRCGNCVMFRAPDGCTLVAGRISPRAVCDWWEAPARGPEFTEARAHILGHPQP